MCSRETVLINTKFRARNINGDSGRSKKDEVGISYSEVIDDAAASRMIDQALENSRFSSVDNYQSITHKRSS